MDQQAFAENSTILQHILPFSNFLFFQKNIQKPAGFVTLTTISANAGGPSFQI